MFSKCVKYLLFLAFLFISTIKENAYVAQSAFQDEKHEILKGGTFRSAEGVIEGTPQTGHFRTLNENINELKNISGNTALLSLSPKKSSAFANYIRVLNQQRDELPKYLLNRNLLI